MKKEFAMNAELELDPHLDLVAAIERMVRQRTSGRVRSFKVEFRDRGIVLSGRASTYYAKQLATHAALDVLENMPLMNDIEVI